MRWQVRYIETDGGSWPGSRASAAGLALLLALAGLAGPAAAAQKVVQPKPGTAGTWRLIGQTHADHGADHDTIIVKGPYDNFRRIKFKVTDAPLNMQHMVVTYDNGAPDKIEIRQNIAAGRREPRHRPARRRQAQHAQDRFLVRHEGLPEGQGRRHRVRHEVRTP